MISEGKTSTGLAYKLDDRVKTDWRLVKLVSKLKNGTEDEQMDACMGIVSLLFADNGEAIEAHVMGLNEGYCPMDAIMNEVAEIIQGNDTLKK